MDYEWDSGKEAANLAKHGISFVAAARVLESGSTLELPSVRGGEARWVAIGAHPTTGKLIAVVYTAREDRFRIISARRARKDEEEEYRRRTQGKGPGREDEERPPQGEGG
jgi:uncharacterized DUF497 family protein